MSASTVDLSEILRTQAERGDDVRHYALVDSAQNPELPRLLDGSGACLFGSRPGTPIARVSPHLVTLPRQRDARAWQRIARYAPASPCLTVMASRLPFDALFRHFRNHLEVKIGKNTMHLAYWDPAILAVLVGQEDDDTLFVQGPVFDPDQRASFLSAVVEWWYWDRRQALHRIEPATLKPEEAQDGRVSALPLEFRPAQTSMMIRASLPDRMLYELDLNRPSVLEGRDSWQNYALTCRLLNVAFEHGIRGLQDQVNLVGTGMILGEGFHRHPAFASQLEDVAAGRLSFNEALERIPEAAFEEAMRLPPTPSTLTAGAP